jgi:hypothetical protein
VLRDLTTVRTANSGPLILIITASHVLKAKQRRELGLLIPLIVGGGRILLVFY